MGVIYQVLCTSIACSISLSMGMVLTWPSSTLRLFASTNTTLNRPMGETEISLFGSLTSIGALISTPIAGYSMDALGRKNTCMLTSLTFLIAWSIIAASNQVELILTAIFISGLGGAVVTIVPVFISEICQESIRGAMTSASLVFYALGMLISYVLGGCLTYNAMIYACLSISVAGVLMLGILKESPMFLMQKGLEEEAAKSVAFYRNTKVDSKIVLEEMDKMRRALNPDFSSEEDTVSPEEEKLKPENKAPAEKLSLWSFFKKSRSTRQATLVTLTLVTASIFQGIVVIQVYAEPLFAEAVPNVSPTICSVLLAAIGIVVGLLAAYLTELSGRRNLMIYSSAATGVCCVALGTQLHLHWAPHWVTAVIIYLFTSVYTLGAGTVPYVLVAEVFLPEVKSLMSMLVIEWAWLCNFVLLFIFNPLVSAIGLGQIFYLFAVICVLSSIFSFFCLPETKGMPVDAIQVLFTKRRRDQKC